MSPVQPSRSSRCGQSVGTARKLPRWDQIELLISWFTPAWELSNQPVRSIAEWTTTASTSSAVRSPGQPVISA